MTKATFEGCEDLNWEWILYNTHISMLHQAECGHCKFLLKNRWF